MNPSRRAFLRVAANAGALSVLPRVALAQKYPARPVRLVVGYAAGGAADTLARIVGQALAERLGQTFLIENRVGAGGNLATETILRASADGYSLLVNTTPNIPSAPLADDFDLSRDMVPIGGISRGSSGDARPPLRASAEPRRVHCLCQGEPRKDHDGVGGQWYASAYGR